MSAGIGGSYVGCDECNIRINGGTVTAIGGRDGSAAIGAGSGQVIFVNPHMAVYADSINPPVARIGNHGQDLASVLSDKRYVAIGALPPVEYRAPVYNVPDTPTSGIAYWETRSTNVYTVIDQGWADSLDDLYAVVPGGWYIVYDAVALMTQNLSVSGEMNLILADGCKLSAGAIRIYGGCTIYAQGMGTGKMDAGGICNCSDPLTINGGHISSCGSFAGIGGCLMDWSGSNITINDGTIYAAGGSGAGIGGADDAGGYNITINGGQVTAIGSDDSAGIGADDHASNIRINGGIIVAIGGEHAAGIGKNNYNYDSPSDFFISSDLAIYADTNNPPVAKLENNGGDLSKALIGKRYVTIVPNVSDERFDAMVRPNHTVVINRAGDDLTGAVTVPSEIGGFPVVEIAPGAFFGRQDITSIVVPGTVTNIGHHAFACCSNLVSLTLPAALAGAGRFLCAECPKLATYVLPEDVEVASCPTDGSGNQIVSVTVAPHVAWEDAPWDGRYDVTYSVLGAKISGAAAVAVRVTATDGVREWSVAMLSGDSSPGAGEHTLVWDAWAELGEASPAKLTLKVALVRLDGQSETLPPLDGSYACDLALASFRTTEGALSSSAVAIDLTAAAPIRYRVANDGTVVITNGAYTADGVAIVPETIDGRAVSGIAEGAYPARDGGVRFDVPTSVGEFDAAALSKWSGLKSVVTTLAFSSSTTNFSIAAIRQFVNLTRVILEGSPEGLSDSLLAFLRSSGLELVYPEEHADAWTQSLARFASAGVTVISAAARTNDATVLDVVYRITGATNALPARAIFFKDNVRSFANIVLPYTFADGTENELGNAMAPAVDHHFAWKVSEDWQIDLAKVRAEVMILPGELLPLKFFTIPANGSHAAMTVSRNALTESRVLDALFWLYAGGEKDLTLKDGVLKCGDTVLAEGASPNGAAAVEYLFGKMGLRLLTGSELEYVNDCARLGFTPQGVRQYAVKEAK